jgi:PTS system mannose-specific IIA component
MPGLLIMAHAPLASALKGVAAHVFPDSLAHVQVLDIQPEWSVEQVEAEARALLGACGQAQTLILTDVFGATPCNVAQRLASSPDVRVVAGVNVPMLWRVLCYAMEPLDALVARAATGGSQGVIPLGGQRPQNQSLPLNTHDPKHAHHQQ